MSIIEIIGSTVEDCIEIEKGGAQRIELVSALEVGGLTPSYGLIRKAK
jgi:copper homeostasis protein